MSPPKDPALSWQSRAQKLMHEDATREDYAKAAQALTAALDDDVALDDEASFDTLVRRLVLQPVPGLHELAHHICQFITSGASETARRTVNRMRAPVTRLADEVDDLSPEERRRFVLFAITTRAFSRDWLSSESVSALHKKTFAQFDRDDLALPYSVIFAPAAFGQNQRDLIDCFLPRGYLETTADLKLPHAVLLAWLSARDIFSGPLTLADMVQRADLSDPLQAAAARSLIMRFEDTDNPVDGGIRSALGLETLTARFHHRPHTSQGDKLGRKNYQVMQAGLNRAKTALPFLAPLQRRPKVALCLSGQMRGYEAALATWKARLLPLIEPEIFVHSWHDVGCASAQPFRDALPFEGASFTRAYREIALTHGFDEMQQRYPTLFHRLGADARVTEEEIQATYSTTHVVLEDDKSEKFEKFGNQHKMHYKIHAADALARSAGDFDLMMRLRPDLSLRDVGFAWSDLLSVARSGPYLFAEKEFGVHYGGILIGDQCAIATPDVMQVYANTWTEFPKLAALGFAEMPDYFSGHVSLAQTCWLNGLDVRRAPILFGGLLEARRLSVADTIAAIAADQRGTKEDQELLNAARSDA